jgi:plasmid stabilization system protein ParE
VSHRLIIRPEAETDMTEAFDWYEDRQANLGHEFLAEVHTSLRAIADHPLHHPVLYKNVRRILTRRFPYKVFFFFEADQVEVIAVIHAKRHPRTWQKRL